MKKMQMNLLKKLLMVVLLLFCVVITAKEKKEEYGMAVFPAEGRVNLDEGTIEAWVSLDYSFDKNHLVERSLVTPMTFFMFEKIQTKANQKQKSNIRDIWIEIISEQGKSMDNNIRYISSLGQKKVGQKVLSGWINFSMEAISWKKGEWHYLAATWKKSGDEYDFTLYIDDKKESITVPANSFKPKDFKEYIVYLGHFKSAQGAIETLRVSDKVRTEDEIRNSFKSGIVEDKSTLLFFNYKTIKKMKKQKSIQFLTQVKMNKNGTFVGPCKMIKGKYGKAVQFHK